MEDTTTKINRTPGRLVVISLLMFALSMALSFASLLASDYDNPVAETLSTIALIPSVLCPIFIVIAIGLAISSPKRK